jgi:hypothetical protein
MITAKDVPPDFFQHYPRMTQCATCDILIPQSEAVQAEDDVYCSEACVREARKTRLIKRPPVRR